MTAQAAPEVKFWQCIFGSPKPKERCHHWWSRPKPKPDVNALFNDCLSRAKAESRKVVAHFYRSGAEAYKEDCEAEACVGLWQAALRYDPSKNDTFWNYAKTRVRGSVYDYLRTVRVIVKSGKPDHTALMFVSGDTLAGERRPDHDGSNTMSLFDSIPGRDTGHLLAEQSFDIDRVFDTTWMTDHQERVFRMHLDGLKNLEIASILEVHPSDVSTELSGLREKLAARVIEMGIFRPASDSEGV